VGDATPGPRHDVWGPIVDRYQRLVYSIPIGRGLDGNDVDNVVQETWARAFERGDPPPEDRIVRYLASIAFWKTREHNRRRSRPGGVPVDTDIEQVSEDDLPAAVLAGLEQQQQVFEAVQSLRPRHREILRCLFYADPHLSYDETARQLKISIGSVGPTRSRALEALRQALIERGALDQ
jgi:RNA polymerase sigma factor (sigma-70 family)